MNIRRQLALAVIPLAALACLLPSAASAQKNAPKSRDEMIDAAVAYLKSSQAEDGTWSKGTSPGITGLVVASLLHTGRVAPADPMVLKALKHLESMVNEKEGHIAGNGEKVFQTNYLTTVNIMALQAADPKKYKTVIDRGVTFLKMIQIDESEDKKQDDPSYGGMGYGAGTRPDLSNTHFFLSALLEAGVPKSDPAFKKAMFFVSRCQNFKSEFNDQPWASKIDDGSFIYVLAAGKKGASETPADAPRPGYASMTYAGLKSLIDGGVPADDPRVKKAIQWVRKNYSVDVNAGRPAGSGQAGYYYCLAIMAKTMTDLKADEIDAVDGTHDWRADMLKALATRQRANGSWTNETPTWQEGNAEVATAFALEALVLCGNKK